MAEEILQFDFAADITNERKGEILMKAKELGLTKSQWNVIFNEQHLCKKILQHVKVVRADSIHGIIPNPANILQPHITFQLLSNLELGRCNLVSMEFLMRLTAPLLETLYLSKNFITNCKPLRKCNFPNIRQLNLQQNPIIECDCLFQIFGSSERFILYLQEFDSTQISYNLNFLAKLQMKPLKIYCESQSRIENNVFWRMIKSLKRKTEMGIKIYKFERYGAM